MWTHEYRETFDAEHHKPPSHANIGSSASPSSHDPDHYTAVKAGTDFSKPPEATHTEPLGRKDSTSGFYQSSHDPGFTATPSTDDYVDQNSLRNASSDSKRAPELPSKSTLLDSDAEKESASASGY